MLAYSLAEIATRLGAAVVNGAGGVNSFPRVASDHRVITPGDLFVAVSGVKHDGHQFVVEAFERGAAAAVVERPVEGVSGSQLIVSDTRRALSALATLAAGDPSRDMRVIGITGTNGKTTTNWLIHHVMNRAGLHSIRIGTLGVNCAIAGLDLPGNLTTPDALEVQGCLSRARSAGAQSAVIEASSHALDQCRVEDLQFDVAVFTNLTRDHMDYHASVEEYRDAKFHLFELLAQSSKPHRTAVINLRDPVGQEFAERLARSPVNVVGFSWEPGGVAQIVSFAERFDGSEVVLAVEGKQYVIRSGFIGRHNAENLAAAFLAGRALGLQEEWLADVFRAIPEVPGRLQRVAAPFGVYVDYAHSPDALENVLKALRPLTERTLWVVFGCGGDRDRGKRPLMASAAAAFADRVVVTSDNPRTEDPQKIVDDILASKIVPHRVELDRRAAIRATLEAASPGDIVLIAGKGHEDYQIVGTKKYHFSDVEEAERVLTARYSTQRGDLLKGAKR